MYSDFFTNCKSTANQLTELDNDLFYCFVLFGANKRGRILDEIHFSELQTTKLKNILTSKWKVILSNERSTTSSNKTFLPIKLTEREFPKYDVK